MRQSLKQSGVDLLRKDVHRHRDEYGTRASFFGQLKGLLQDLGEQIRSVHAPHPLDERPIDFRLRRVSVQIDFLVRMLAVVVARNIARDDDHRNGVERRVGDPGGCVRQTRAQVRQDDRGRVLGPCVAICHVRGNLFMARVDELQGRALEFGQHSDVGMSAKAEDVFHSSVDEVLHQLLRNQFLHASSASDL